MGEIDGGVIEVFFDLGFVGVKLLVGKRNWKWGCNMCKGVFGFFCLVMVKI